MNRQHAHALYAFADQYGVPRNIALALVRQESGGNPNARSPVGAEGYTQLMPGTARGLGVNPRNPIDNLRGGMMYLGHLIKAFKGNIRYALAAYNAGPAAVTRYGGIPPYKETQNYVRSIMAMAGPGQSGGQVNANRLRAVNTMQSTNTIGAVQPQLQAALDLSAPSEATQSILGRLGGTAARAAEGASAPIPLPASLTPRGGQGLPSLPGSNTGINMPRIEVQGKVTARDRKVVGLVQEAMGTPYVWGGNKPGGFDCSGLLQYYWGKVGVNIPRVTYDQWKTGQAVGKGQLRAGDAVFFHKGPRGPEHVGMYVGGGKFIEAPHTGAKVRISVLAGRKDFMGARRYA